MASEIERVLLSDIDFKNDFYKISRNSLDAKLKTSIENFGVLELPFLLRNNDKLQLDHKPRVGRPPFMILSGHNRLKVVRELKYESVDAVITEQIDSGAFLKYVLLKNYRDEIGSVSKIKLISILRYNLGFDDKKIASICKSDLHIPDFFYKNDKIINSVINLPVELKDYIDNRKIGYKVIKNVLRLDRDCLLLINNWIQYTNFRVNYFKNIVDFIVDLRKRDGGIGELESISLDDIDDRREREEYIYNEVFRIRYPEYSKMYSEAREIIGRLNRAGVDINFPEYFEGSSITVKLIIGKNDDLNRINENFKKVDRGEIEKLLGLL